MRPELWKRERDIVGEFGWLVVRNGNDLRWFTDDQEAEARLDYRAALRDWHGDRIKKMAAS